MIFKGKYSGNFVTERRKIFTRRMLAAAVLCIPLSFGVQPVDAQSLAGDEYQGFTAVEITPDGKILAGLFGDGQIVFVDLAPEGSTRFMERARGLGTRDASFTSAGAALLTAGQDGAVRLWDVATGQQSAAFDGNSVPLTTIGISPDGRLIAGGAEDGRVLLFDASSGRITSTLDWHASAVAAVGFAPDGKTIATVGESGVIALWDLSKANVQRTFGDETGAVSALVFGLEWKGIVQCGRRWLRPRVACRQRTIPAVLFFGRLPDNGTRPQP